MDLFIIFLLDASFYCGSINIMVWASWHYLLLAL